MMPSILLATLAVSIGLNLNSKKIKVFSLVSYIAVLFYICVNRYNELGMSFLSDNVYPIIVLILSLSIMYIFLDRVEKMFEKEDE